jgi:putative ABC transport system permease protein
MNGLGRLLASSFRRLTKAPGFTALIVVPLTFGIGANAAIFSIVNSILLRPLPYAQPERLVNVWETAPQAQIDQSELSAPDFFDLAAQSRSFSALGAATPYWSTNLTGEGEPEKLATEVVTASLFPVLGVHPVLGSAFVPADDKPGGRDVVVLSNALWQRRFGGAAGVIGHTLVLDGRPFEVIGVMPPRFSYLSAKTDLYLPLTYTGNAVEARSMYFLRAVGRLRPAAAEARARAEVRTLGAALARQYPESNAGRTFDLEPFQESVVGAVRPTFRLLLGIVGFVLLIACANVANLLSIRAVGRQRELALKAVLGARRGRIFAELLAESLMLALLGGALGLLLATWAVHLFSRMAPADLPRAQEIGVGWPVVLFTLALSLLTTLLFGLAPALQSSRADLNEALSQGGRSSGGVIGKRFRDVLAVLEVSLAIVLLVGAGLLVKSFLHLRAVDPGYDPNHVLTFDVVLSDAKYPALGQRHRFFESLTASLAAVPGVSAVGGINYLPLTKGSASSTLAVEGRPTPPGTPAPTVDLRTVTAGYFRAMRIPLRAGRTFTPDDRPRGHLVVVVNQALRDQFWPGQDAVGKRVQLGGPDPRLPWLTVVGVVGSVRAHGLATKPSPEIYVHVLQAVPTGMTMILRTAGDPALLARETRRRVWDLDPDLPVSNVSTLREQLSSSISRERLLMTLLGAFALVALVLGIIGVYGVISYSVVQRTREIGIRLALGAPPRQVLRSVVKRAMALALIGVLGGLAGAAALSRFVSGIVYATSPTDLPTFLGIAALMSLAALLASYIPARRAMKIDPLVALRFD